TVKLEADPSFGTRTDWESIFYKAYEQFTVGPAGNIFVSNSRQHNIYKFTPSGKLEAHFGRKGRGPGDLYYPSNLSILDDKYLVVGEYATTRRISIFDLDGKCVKILKAGRSVFSPIALKNNRIAYMGQSLKSRKTFTFKIIIKDATSGKEILVTSPEITNNNYIRSGSNSMVMFKSRIGYVVINRTPNGNLVVGVSNTPDITIYSPEGKRIRSFRLNIKPVAVTNSYIREFKESMIAGAIEDRSASNYINAIKKANFESFFADNLPFYRDIIVDSEGNFLVFKWLACIDDCPKTFQVYSPEGNFLRDTTFDEGEFDFEIDSISRSLIFSKKGMFGLFQIKGSEDVSLRIVKFKLTA
ncbi:MAG: 6-bladed beta-propeller, partial [bacterium]|nr:6-bladed beta-propeller [bacterium]